jgi:hypothetical protein
MLEEIVDKSGSPAVQSADFERFMYTDVAIEQNGMPLSVLSALSRRGIDPWQEAERLSQLPRSEAADGLARTLAGLPTFRSSLADTSTIASRLVALLPSPKSTGPAVRLPEAKEALNVAPRWMVLGMVAAVVAGLLLPNAASKKADTVAPASWFAEVPAAPAKPSAPSSTGAASQPAAKQAEAPQVVAPAPSGQ